MPAWWIPDEQAEQRALQAIRVVDAVSVLGTHLAELIRRHAHELFSRQDAKKLLDRVAVDIPKWSKTWCPNCCRWRLCSGCCRICCASASPSATRFPFSKRWARRRHSTRNPVLLTEYVRQAIRRTVVKPYLNATGNLPAYFLDPAIEQAVESAVEHGEQNSHLSLAPQTIRDILDRIQRKVGNPEGAGGGRNYLRRALFSSANRRTLAAQSLLSVAQRDSGRRESSFPWRDPVEEKYANQIVLCKLG